jgi:general secretion pathway protein G
MKKHLLRPFSSAQKGFSLIEIIIVVALLGSLMTILIRNVMTSADEARIGQAKIGMAGIFQSMQMYRVHNNMYPTTAQGLDALLNNPGDSPKWRGPYIEKDKLTDPWDTPYGYNSDGRTYEIISAGPDKQMDTADDIFYPERDEGAQGAEGSG